MKTLLKTICVGLLTMEARAVLAKHAPIVVAVTGSVGKTGTKDAIYSVLKTKHHVRKSEKSFNSEIGVPLTILGLAGPGGNMFAWILRVIEGFCVIFSQSAYPKILVLEMGVGKPGDMAWLASWVVPDVVVLTRFPDVPVHVEYFASAEAVAEEKLALMRALPADGVIVYNRDDERITRAVEGAVQRALSFSRYSRAEYTAAADTIVSEHGVPAGFEFVLNAQGSVHVVHVAGGLGLGYVYAYTAAIAVGSLFDVAPAEAIAALRTHVPQPGRMRIIPGEKDTTIIDDTYNASPAAAEEALRTLGAFQQAKRRIAILGDMLELGTHSVEEHMRIGGMVPKYADLLATIGVRARGFAEGALRAGMDEEAVAQYDNVADLIREIEPRIQAGDVVLVKASQGIRAERIVEELMAEPERAPELLVRHDAFWRAITPRS